jgi:hypothetical protein
MKPETETLLLVIGSLLGFLLLPIILITFRDYLLAIITIFLFITSFAIVIYYGYIELLPVIKKKHNEEKEIAQLFGNDPEKMRFYKGFKKYFDGDVNADGLKLWLETHQIKPKK